MKVLCRLLGHRARFDRISLPRFMYCTRCGKRLTP